MRHTFQEAAGAAVCALLVAVLLNVQAFGQDHHPHVAAQTPSTHASAPSTMADPRNSVFTPSAVPQPRDLAAMHKDLMEKLRGAFELAAELFSGNHTHLLSDIEAQLLSNNKAALLSGNKPEILSNNQMPVFSGNRIEFFSNLKIDIHIENTGNNSNNQPAMPMPGMSTMPGAPGATTRPSTLSPLHAPGPVTRPMPHSSTAPAVPSVPTPPH